MSNAIKPRFSIDLDEIERQLGYASQAPVAPVRPEPVRPTVVHPAPASGGTGRNDPMAELARIVGQDDPFGNLFANDKPARPRVPSYEDVFGARDNPPPAQARKSQAEAYEAAQYADAPRLEADDRPVRDEAHYAAPRAPQGREAHAADLDQDYYDEPSQGGDYEQPRSAPRRSRKALVAVVSVVGAAALGIGATLTLSGKGSSITGGEPPLVQASAGPVKVAPQSPGGVEFPNQNKQIYERAVPDDKTRVVNREEQPVDLRQATRVVPPSPDTTATVAPSASGGGALGLGEPKRVRTVTIRPDGTVVGAPPAPHAAAPAPSMPAMAALPAAASPASPAAAPSRAAAATPSTPAPRPTASTPAATTGGASPQAAAPATPVQPAPQRVASVGPTSLPVAAATPAPASEAAVGGFSVQIGVRPTEGEARTAFAQAQQKFSELGGQSALIRKAEVNGNTLYRVRVGPMSKDDASSLCAKLQGSGGQCFVAKN